MVVGQAQRIAEKSDTSDRHLLRAYVRDGSNDAFAALVERHLAMVYQAALRRAGAGNGGPAAAEDIAQAVFIVLAKKSPSLLKVRTLGGWLLRVTRCAATDLVRKQKTRARHEQTAARAGNAWANAGHPRPATGSSGDSGCELDDALERLASPDREALILRFYQDATFAEMGIALGITEEAARKRTRRALDRLKRMLHHRGMLRALPVLLAFIHKSPVPASAMTQRITAQATMSHGLLEIKMSLAKGVLHMMSLNRMKMALAASTAAALAIGAGAWWYAASHDSQTPVNPAAQVATVNALPPAAVPQGDVAQSPQNSALDVADAVTLAEKVQTPATAPAVIAVFTLTAIPDNLLPPADPNHLYDDQGVPGEASPAASGVMEGRIQVTRNATLMIGGQIAGGQITKIEGTVIQGGQVLYLESPAVTPQQPSTQPTNTVTFQDIVQFFAEGRDILNKHGAGVGATGAWRGNITITADNQGSFVLKAPDGDHLSAQKMEIGGFIVRDPAAK